MIRKGLFFFLFALSYTTAQAPLKPNATEIYHQIKKLNVLASVLYIAAHPDDENTRLLSYMANQKLARTAYLSLTRGDGGQNLIGPELRELLGVIRTQELLEARKIDGAEQYFTRANDFGFSKKPNETLQIWDKNLVLQDIDFIINTFQPDIIINRFDHRTPGTTHGHHTASALLALEWFDAKVAAATPNQGLPKRIFFNTSWWFYGGKDKFEKADKSNLIGFDIGVFYPYLGKSNQEIAALSRSKHQSQGFGTTPSRGEEIEYIELVRGSLPQNKENLFEGINTTWSRLKGGEAVGTIIEQVINEYQFDKPYASVPKLLKAYTTLQQLEPSVWKQHKLQEIKNSIASAMGLYLEAVAKTQTATPPAQVEINLEAINRSPITATLISVTTSPQSETNISNQPLAFNKPQYNSIVLNLSKETPFTQPFWLEKEGTMGMYAIPNQEVLSHPETLRQTTVTFLCEILGIQIPFERTIVYKYNDDVKGEVYHPFDITPAASISFPDEVIIFKDKTPKAITLNIKANQPEISGDAQLILPKGWKVSPEKIPFTCKPDTKEQTVFFTVYPPDTIEEVTGYAQITTSGTIISTQQRILSYNHIARQQVLLPAKVKLNRIEVKTTNQKIAYIMGAGDEVPQALKQLGYSVTLIKPEQISTALLADFEVLITGIRAYNVCKELASKQQILFNWVATGKTMLVQYNTTDDLVTTKIAPYPLKISRQRVTDENAPVTLLNPKHPALQKPNTITPNDFKNWVQEQGLYYPDTWDAAFEPLLSSQDPDEDPKKGALLVAKHGKGYYIYTGLSFFRELPAGVSGAYRLLANLIALKQ